MKQFESAFLGLILAGVLMMITGLGLLMSSGRSSDGARALLAERQVIDRSPAFDARIDSMR